MHLVVSVREPPREGRANAAIIRLLARHFDIPQSDVRIIVGLQSKEKVVELHLRDRR